MSEAALSHDTPIRVRFGEIDGMGIVYHPNYLSYMEMGRTEFMRDLGLSYREVEEGGIRLVVADVGARYLKPAKYDEELVVRTFVHEVGRVRLSFRYEVRRGDDLLATGHTVLASTDHRGRLRRLPETLLELLGRSGTPAGVKEPPSRESN
jgi:acyl-CoA thioester hydrolase